MDDKTQTNKPFLSPDEMKSLIPESLVSIVIESQDLKHIVIDFTNKNKEAQKMYKQPAVLHQYGSRFPTEIELSLDSRGLPDGTLPQLYEVGTYLIPASSFKVDQYKGLQFQLNTIHRVK